MLYNAVALLFDRRKTMAFQFHIFNHAGEKFFLKSLEVGEVPVSENGKKLGYIVVVRNNDSAPTGKMVFLHGYIAGYSVY